MAELRRRSSNRQLALALASFACTAPALAETIVENGTATWYGGRHVGRSTSSGETFSATELTAAHPFLPLGTRVRVTVMDTGSSVVVRINDRQPVHGHRVIDLSREAAAQLGMLGRGTAPVRVATVDAEPVEVAMAPIDAGLPADNSMSSSDVDDPVSASPRGRPHMRRGRRAVATALPCCHAPFAVRVQHSVPHQAARRTL